MAQWVLNSSQSAIGMSIRIRTENRKETGSNRRGLKLLISLLLLICTALVLERVRGQWGLKVWAREMTAKGAATEPAQVWPVASDSARQFGIELDEAVKALSENLRRFGGITCIVPSDASAWSRGSQRAKPVFNYTKSGTNTWADVSIAVRVGESALRKLRQLLHNPPEGIPYDYAEALKSDSMPNYVSFRIGAQALQTTALCDLHNRDLGDSISNILALEGLIRARNEDPNLVSLMIRFAILGITVDVLWDALQAEGWNEQDLKTVQKLCEENRRLLSQMPRAMDGERLAHLAEIEWFRTHSYNKCVERKLPIIESFGVQRADIDRLVAPRFWRQWFFHPVWSFAWADQEKLQYLRAEERDAEAVRQAVSGGSWRGLEAELAANQKAYRAPECAWRFYRRLPLHEIPTPDWKPLKPGEYPYGSFSRAWFTALRLLTLNEMAITAVAIKRYELQHGKPPSALTDLCPAPLSQVPRDFMDGEPLRYRPRPDGTYNLYSIGANLRDDGGAVTVPTTKGERAASPWDGADWVWQ
jgi:hypothetical protein